jgi:hypothetical protein
VKAGSLPFDAQFNSMEIAEQRLKLISPDSNPTGSFQSPALPRPFFPDTGA